MAAPKPEEFGLSEEKIFALDSQLWRARLAVGIVAGLIGLAVALKIGYDFFVFRDRDPLYEFGMIGVPVGLFVAAAVGLFFFIITLQVPLKFWPAQLQVKRYRQAVKEARVHEHQKLKNYWTHVSAGRLQREVLDLYRGLGYEVSTPPSGTEAFTDYLLRKDDMTVLVGCRPLHEELDFGPVKLMADAVKAQKADRAILVSILGFSKRARRLAQGKPVGLISVPELSNMQRFLEQQAAAEALGEVSQA